MRSSSQKSITFADIKKTWDREEKTSKNNLYNKKKAENYRVWVVIRLLQFRYGFDTYIAPLL